MFIRCCADGIDRQIPCGEGVGPPTFSSFFSLLYTVYEIADLKKNLKIGFYESIYSCDQRDCKESGSVPTIVR